MAKRHARLSLIFIVSIGLWACTLHGTRTDKIAAMDIPLNTGVNDPSFLTDMEKEIIVELNTVRVDPKRYTDFLKSLVGRSQWKQGLDEAILFIEKQEPLPPFKASKGLSLAARSLVNDGGQEGLTGHVGKDGKSMFDRMNIYGKWEGKAGEYLGYGYTEAEAVVARLAIEEGAAGKEGKAYLFDRDFLVVGVSCGPHKSYRIMCAIDFAHSYKENPDLP
jgi:hypothetical protein